MVQRLDDEVLTTWQAGLPMWPPLRPGESTLNDRMAYIQAAWKRAADLHVGPAIRRQVEAEFYDAIREFLPGLLDAFGVYLKTVAGFAAVGGVVGFFAGEGAAAYPGAVLGAQIGNLVAGWYLAAIGLKELAVGIGKRCGEIGQGMLAGVKLAWESRGNQIQLDQAAQHMASAVGVVFAGLAAALIELALRKGTGHAKAKLAQSRFGRKVAAWVVSRARLEWALREVLGMPTAGPTVRRRVLEAVRFFEEHREGLRERDGRPLTDTNHRDFLRGIDYHSDVVTVKLPRGTVLVSYQNPKIGPGRFFTVPGTFSDRLGIDDVGREWVKYVVRQDVTILKSRTTGVTIRGDGGPVYASGGGVQFIVPNAKHVLEMVYVHFPGKPERLQVAPRK